MIGHALEELEPLGSPERIAHRRRVSATTGATHQISRIRAAVSREQTHPQIEELYRADGSDAYLHWVLRLLGLEPGEPVPWFNEETFTVDVIDSPAVVESTLRTWLNRSKNARMTADLLLGPRSSSRTC